MNFLGFVVVYLCGVCSFPLALVFIAVYAYRILPRQLDTSDSTQNGSNSLRHGDDDAQSIKSGRSLTDLAEKFHRGHEADVAAGYFAVCREYVPGGVNGKPPERTTPAGSVIPAESPSVYQSMYRSLFDRKQAPTLDPTSVTGKTIKRARNVFYVVLRHGHLMLYEDSSQIEVKYVIALEHHHVSVYSGGDETPEGELFIKRNSIMLSNKNDGEMSTSKPFHFFSENCSDKESFYFALLQNQEIKHGATDNPPRPLEYESKHIIGLVQRLHSSEEQLQTKWLNAMIGRMFLAHYKTPELEDFIRKKVAKKIARVKKPAYLSHIVLQKIDLGQSAPQILNPRLKDLTIDGDCCAEADIRYSGHLRLEIATTARIDLGARFKAREVSLVLAITVKKLNGHGLIKFKPAPSNRLWMSFKTMPDMEMTVEPIVSSRQITYGFILRTIEARIREVLAETIVLPHWDDLPFSDTSSQRFRGGIWAALTSHAEPPVEQTTIVDEAPEDEAEAGIGTSVLTLPSGDVNESTVSLPAVPHDIVSQDLKDNVTNLENVSEADHSVQGGVFKTVVPPKALRSRSFASAANPLVSMDTANVETTPLDQTDKKRRRQQNAASAMMALNEKSRPSSPPDAPTIVAVEEPSLWHNPNTNNTTAIDLQHEAPSEKRSRPTSLSENFLQESSGSTMPDSNLHPAKLAFGSETSKRPSVEMSNGTNPDKKQTVAALNAATVAAKNWGWGVLNRKTEPKIRSTPDAIRVGTPEHPIGRGRPLPPPGEPLPFPPKQKSRTLPPPSPRKPVPPTRPPKREEGRDNKTTSTAPPLPARRRRSSGPMQNLGDGELLVVEAPVNPRESSALEDKSTESITEAALDLGQGERRTDEHTSWNENDGKAARVNDANGAQRDLLDIEDDDSIAAWQGDLGNS